VNSRKKGVRIEEIGEKSVSIEEGGVCAAVPGGKLSE